MQCVLYRRRSLCERQRRLHLPRIRRSTQRKSTHGRFAGVQRRKRPARDRLWLRGLRTCRRHFHDVYCRLMGERSQVSQCSLTRKTIRLVFQWFTKNDVCEFEPSQPSQAVAESQAFCQGSYLQVFWHAACSSKHGSCIPPASCGWGGGEGYDGVMIFNSSGTPIGRIEAPERCANVCFGGPKRNRLFMTARRSSLYSLYVGIEGAPGG